MATFFVPALLFALDVSIAKLINRVVRQVHEVVVDVAGCRFAIWLSAKAGQSLFVDVDS